MDPGFWGRLLIPLHNLTLNEYTFQSGQKCVWFEFTKVSPNYWDETHERDQSKLKGVYKPFDPNKTEVPPEEYLNKAHPKPIRSSIPDALERSTKSAEDARDENRKIRRAVSTIGGVALLAGAYGGYQLVLSSNQRFDGIMHSVAQLQREIGTIGTRADQQWRAEIEVFSQSVQGMREDRLSDFEARFDEMRSQVSGLARSLGDFDPLQIQEQVDELRAAISSLEADLNELQEQSDR